MTKLRTSLLALVLVASSACTGGINAGGETETSNGGIAWIAMAGMLIAIGIVLYLVIGRDD
jgi:hypothetical protein